jgi:SPP1 family phage portal protein
VNIDEILILPVPEQMTILQSQSLKLWGPDKLKPEYTELEKQYNPNKHDVFNTGLRPFKEVKRAIENGQDQSGNETYRTQSEDVNRIAVPYQQLIVERAIGFMLGNPITVKSNADGDSQELLVEMIKRTLKDNKSQYFDRKLARVVMSQCEAAELWYFAEDPVFWKRTIKATTNNILKLRVKLLSPGAGDLLYPYFDETGDMTAFSRGYQITDVKGKVTEHFDTWTDTKAISRISENGGWVQTVTINPMGKIPVIYYWQQEPEWANVQSVIERYETKCSNFADTNDYFGAPMVKVIGEVTSLPGKTTQGKVIQLSQGSDASYMSWSSAPESEKLEFELLEKQIYSMTQTPNISFEQMKSMGGDMSGFAIKLMFTDAHLKVANKQELFGEMFTRRLNLIKHVCGNVINVSLSADVNLLEVEPVFEAFLPQNTKEEIEILAIARANKPLLSNQTAIERNPLAVNVDEEMTRMEADNQADTELVNRELNGSFV